MVKTGLMRKDKVKYGVKLLNRGYMDEFDMQLDIEVSDASESAISLIKSKGGNIVCAYRTALKMKEHVFPEKFPFELSDPVVKKSVVN